ncbi:MAG TPA: hypothetical protein VM124_02330 [Candidatus Limnocylindrales bacterium]|nr:hypothetical protein [Candidatus Limnocylindrales bacterium]
MLDLLAGGNRTPLGPGGPVETAFGTRGPEWRPFVAEAPPHDIPKIARALGQITDVTGVRHPVTPSSNPFLN